MRVMPAEWEKQQCIVMSFPHEDTDWAEGGLKSAISPFIRIAQAIAYKQAVYIICRDKDKISSMFCSTRNMTFIEIPTNDTWIRDYGYISILENGKKRLLDFTFDGWGGKFEASLDNSVNAMLHKKGYMGVTSLDKIDFVLEGGSIESDGEGTIMTTTRCLCNPNRNYGLDKKEVETRLKSYLGAKRVLWLDSGYLAGDDTDSHVDMLARFVNKDTIAYIKCDDKEDEHYEQMKQMEIELETFCKADGKPYTLIPLPMTDAIYNENGDRLPSSYANFLICNEAILYPTYDDKQDKLVHDIFKNLFPKKEIIPINSLKLIEQGGSIHCSTMQVVS